MPKVSFGALFRLVGWSVGVSSTEVQIHGDWSYLISLHKFRDHDLIFFPQAIERCRNLAFLSSFLAVSIFIPLSKAGSPLPTPFSPKSSRRKSRKGMGAAGSCICLLGLGRLHPPNTIFQASGSASPPDRPRRTLGSRGATEPPQYPLQATGR